MTGPAHRPSARVRLEASLLDAEGDAASPAADAGLTAPRLTVLVVAAEGDLRRYVRECLRERPGLHVVEAASVPAAVALAARHAPACLVVDEPAGAVLSALAAPRAVLLVDELPRGAPDAEPRVRRLARPFSADELLSALAPLLG